MLAGFTAMTYGLSTLTIYRVPHFVERGLDPTLVAAAISVDAVIAVVASVLLGRVLDRAPLRIVLLGGIAVGALCAVGLLLAGSVFWLFAANIFYALGFQSTHVAQSVMWANQFGRRHQGDLRGFTIPVTVGVGALAFPVTGYLRDVAGEYTPAWFVSIGALVVAGALLVAVRPVRRTGDRCGQRSPPAGRGLRQRPAARFGLAYPGEVDESRWKKKIDRQYQREKQSQAPRPLRAESQQRERCQQVQADEQCVHSEQCKHSPLTEHSAPPFEVAEQPGEHARYENDGDTRYHASSRVQRAQVEHCTNDRPQRVVLDYHEEEESMEQAEPRRLPCEPDHERYQEQRVDVEETKGLPVVILGQGDQRHS